MFYRTETPHAQKTEGMTPMAIVMACGLSVGLAASSGTAFAQDSQESLEWSDDEGTHEEEWYDPSDWFDDDFDGIDGADTDYEYDYNYFGDDAYVLYDNETYDSDWWSDADQTLYVDGYYDGYLDGYSDDGYGHDYRSLSSDDASGDASSSASDNKGTNRYNAGYYAGFDDGQYDAESELGSNWTYYLFAVPVQQQDADSEQKRQANSARQRGDRSKEARTGDMDRAESMEMAHSQGMQRIRGTVAAVEHLKDEQLGDSMKDHTVFRLTMEDGGTIVCDLGPNADENVISEGDRITIKGRRIDRSGMTIFDASRLSVNNTLLWNTQGKNEPTRVSHR